MKRFLATLFAFTLCGASLANEDLRIADSCYTARAEHAVGDKANAKNAKLMIDSYHKAMKDPALSMWGNERGALASVKDGVATTVRDVAIMAEDYQVLGRAHFVLPYVPLVLSWPDKKLADKYLSLALEKNPRDLYNYYFLAELRFDQKRYADALNIIDRGLSRGIRTNNFLEDKRGRWHLKELQKQINAKLDKKK